jgi:uncharacterized protein (TIGR00290 family)
MGLKKKVTISWSGGKDSAFALYKVLLSGDYEVVHLHTVFNPETGRVGMHGIREALIERQAAAIGIPLHKLYLESSADHAAYAELMDRFYRQCAREGIQGVVFGDIFLEDLRQFRDQLVANASLEALYPLWLLDTTVLINDFINAGFKTLLCAANAQYFAKDDVGKTINHDFMARLPANVDPCGERGEFHTFVYEGPLMKQPIPFELGDVVEKRYRYTKVAAAGNPEEVESVYWFQEVKPVL